MLMQTFLPYPSFEASAACLDNKRLGKQRVEAYQLLLGQFPNHPAAKMWVGYEKALWCYAQTICTEWVKRGFSDTIHVKLGQMTLALASSVAYPMWLGNHEFHASHRSNLLRKDFEWYSQFGWTETSDLPYVWPVV